MNSIEQLLKEYKIYGRGERLGQYFCNRYIKKPMPELYYQENSGIALGIIRNWLQMLDYRDELPMPLDEREPNVY